MSSLTSIRQVIRIDWIAKATAHSDSGTVDNYKYTITKRIGWVQVIAEWFTNHQKSKWVAHSMHWRFATHITITRNPTSRSHPYTTQHTHHAWLRSLCCHYAASCLAAASRRHDRCIASQDCHFDTAAAVYCYIGADWRLRQSRWQLGTVICAQCKSAWQYAATRHSVRSASATVNRLDHTAASASNACSSCGTWRGLAGSCVVTTQNCGCWIADSRNEGADRGVCEWRWWQLVTVYFKRIKRTVYTHNNLRNSRSDIAA